MKYIPCILLLLFLTTACYSPQRDCQKFKTGTFQYSSYADGKIIETKIVRNDTIEIDYLNPQHPDTARIRWVNDCEYIATKYRPKNQREKQGYQFKITETTKNSYTFEFSKVGEAKSKEITAKRIAE